MAAAIVSIVSPGWTTHSPDGLLSRGTGDSSGMDFGDYLEQLNVTLRAMVALGQREQSDHRTKYLAARFGEALRDVLEVLQRVESMLAPAAEAAE
jgi:hypothetical protein